MKKLLSVPVLALLLIGTITNCDMPETEVHVAQDFMTNVSQVSFINDTSDGAAGKLLEDIDNVAVEITGPDADKIYNIEGKKQFKIQGGRLHLLLSPAYKFVTDKDSYTANIIVNVPGYLKRIVPFTFIKNINNGFLEVALLKKTELPQGIALSTVKTGSVGTELGLDKSVNLIASNANVEGVTTEINIPEGIKMKDIDGNPLSGNLSTEVISFTDNGDLTAYFPGGLMPTNINMKNGTSESGAFVSAGFTAINMTVGGKQVKNFEGGKVDVKMTLGKNTFNPVTGNPFKKGDKIGIWSYDDDSAQWSEEGEGLVEEDENGSLFVKFQTSHLSYFNLDYLERGNGGACWYTKFKIKWAGLSYENRINARFKFKYVGPSGTSSTYHWYQTVLTTEGEVYDGAEINLYNAPNLPIEIELYDMDNGKSLVTKKFNKGDLCSGNSEIIITNPIPVQQLINLTYEGLCSGIQVYPFVGTRVYYRQVLEKSSWKFFHYVYYNNRFDKNITTNKLKVGETYEFLVYAGGEKQQFSLTIKSTENHIKFKLPDALCKSLIRGR
jgi:hypothetical protein